MKRQGDFEFSSFRLQLEAEAAVSILMFEAFFSYVLGHVATPSGFCCTKQPHNHTYTHTPTPTTATHTRRSIACAAAFAAASSRRERGVAAAGEGRRRRSEQRVEGGEGG